MLKLFAKIGADTAENEQHFAEILPIGRRVADRGQPVRGLRRGARRVRRAALPALAKLAKLVNFEFFFAKFCKFLAGSFSAVSKRNFARKNICV